MSRLKTGLFVLALLACRAPARAHLASDSYLALRRSEHGVAGEWDIALRDLEPVLALDANADGSLTWGEVAERKGEVAAYALEHLGLESEGARCTLTSRTLGIVSHGDGAFVRLAVEGRCPSRSALALHYGLLFDVDASHRAIVRIGEATRVLGPKAPTLRLEGLGEVELGAMVREGAAHIFGGLDHVLFLLALLLRALVRATPGGLRARLGEVVRLVTAFTAAHSITLACAVLGVASVPASIIEPAIALTVALAAIDNLWLVADFSRARLAFLLGLLHGFGFSSALASVGAEGWALAGPLFAFNLGVELGQLAIVVSVVPLVLALGRARRGPQLMPWLMRGGSLAILAFALVWLVERVAPS